MTRTPIRDIRRVAWGPIVAAVLVLGWAGTARAHDAAAYYTDGRWPNRTTESYWIATGPGGVPFVGRVERTIVLGAAQWNARNQPLHFRHRGWVDNVGIIQPPACSANGASFVFQYNLDAWDPNWLGATHRCRLDGGRGAIDSFYVAFDTRSWYSDEGVVPAGAPDRWSVSSHEFGHATGWVVHWPDTSPNCQENANKLTMCRTISIGQSWQRDLGFHDIDTFEAAY